MNPLHALRMKWGRPLFRTGMLVALSAIVADQASKLWIVHGLRLPDTLTRRIDILPFFDLTYTENRGISFGLFGGGLSSRILFSALSIAVSLFIIDWLTRIERKVAALGAGLILGGAIGNVIDRIAYGYVVDFLDFSQLGFPFIFNVADVAINIGFALLVLDALYFEKRTRLAD